MWCITHRQTYFGISALMRICASDATGEPALVTILPLMATFPWEIHDWTTFLCTKTREVSSLSHLSTARADHTPDPGELSHVCPDINNRGSSPIQIILPHEPYLLCSGCRSRHASSKRLFFACATRAVCELAVPLIMLCNVGQLGQEPLRRSSVLR